MPKTVDTRSHCKVWLRACNNLPQPPPYISFFWGCGRLLHALNHTLQWLLVSTVFGTVSSLHLNFIFNDFYTCICIARERENNLEVNTEIMQSEGELSPLRHALRYHKGREARVARLRATLCVNMALMIDGLATHRCCSRPLCHSRSFWTSLSLVGEIKVHVLYIIIVQSE